MECYQAFSVGAVDGFAHKVKCEAFALSSVARFPFMTSPSESWPFLPATCVLLCLTTHQPLTMNLWCS